MTPKEDPSAPRRRPHWRSNWLCQEEVDALLLALRGDGSILGLRAYALLLCLLRCAQLPKLVRTLRWGAIQVAGAAEAAEATDDRSDIWVSWPRARRLRREPLPCDVWRAIRAYLQASGRLQGIAARHYVFAALADPGAPLSGDARQWLADKPLSSEALTLLLNRCLEWAGLEVGPFTADELRRTAVMLRVQDGAALEEIQDWLGHRSYHSIRDYIHASHANPPSQARRRAARRLARQAAQRVSQVGPLHPAALLGETQAGAGPRLGPPAALPPLEPPPAHDRPISLEEALANLQVILDRVYQRSAEPRSAGELMHFTELFGRTTMRLAGLKANLRRTPTDELRAAIEIARREVIAEMRAAGRFKL